MLTDKKITNSDKTSQGVVAAPDTLTGTPQQNKGIFDRLVSFFADKYNALIDAFVAITGASEIGTTSGNVQTDLNNRYTKSEVYTKSETNTQIDNKVVQIGAGDMAKAIYDTFNRNTDVFEYTYSKAETYSKLETYSQSETDNKFAEKLKSNLNIYVSPQGSDTLGDGTQGKPYKTITYALSTVPKVMNDSRVKINLAQGTYAENVHIGGFVGAGYYQGIVIQGGSSLADSINYKVNCVEISNVSNNVNINGIKTMSFSNGSKCTVFASKAFINNCDFTEGPCAYGVLCGQGMSGVQISNCTISNTSLAAIMSFDNSILSVRNVSGSNNATGLCAGSSSAATGGIIMKGSNISLGATTAEAKFYGGQIFA